MIYEDRYMLMYVEAVLGIADGRCTDCFATSLPLVIYEVLNRYERLADAKVLCPNCLVINKKEEL